jgi:hypothetical protein
MRVLSDQWSRSSAQSLLPTALSAAVPLWINDLFQRGGLTLEDWQRLADLGQLLAAHGDALLFHSPKEGETAQVFNALAEALALLAFLPGGVSFAGQHFDALPLLTHALGAEGAASYLAQVRQARRA